MDLKILKNLVELKTYIYAVLSWLSRRKAMSSVYEPDV